MNLERFEVLNVYLRRREATHLLVFINFPVEVLLEVRL
jgi:hypothetical protein